MPPVNSIDFHFPCSLSFKCLRVYNKRQIPMMILDIIYVRVECLVLPSVLFQVQSAIVLILSVVLCFIFMDVFPRTVRDVFYLYLQTTACQGSYMSRMRTATVHDHFVFGARIDITFRRPAVFVDTLPPNTTLKPIVCQRTVRPIDTRSSTWNGIRRPRRAPVWCGDKWSAK